MFHWSELNELGRSNQAWKLANLMFPSMRLLDKPNGWQGQNAYFYLDAEHHLEPKPFGMKVTLEVKDTPPTVEDLYQVILNY